MSRVKRVIGALSAAVAVLALSTGVVLGAVQRASLTVQAAPAGTVVTLHVEATARFAGADPGILMLVPKLALDAAAPGMQCEAITGSAMIADMTWRTGEVTFGVETYDGFIGDATFTVPSVPPAAYYLAEPIDARGTGCHPFANFTVTTGQLPDTAVSSTPGLSGIKLGL